VADLRRGPVLLVVPRPALAFGSLGWACRALLRRHAGGEQTSHYKESGVSDHTMLGAHRQAVKMPLAAHIPPGNRVGETLGGTQILDETRHLSHGRDVAAKQRHRV